MHEFGQILPWLVTNTLIFLADFFPATPNTHILFYQQSSKISENRKMEAVEMNGRASLKVLAAIEKNR